MVLPFPQSASMPNTQGPSTEPISLARISTVSFRSRRSCSNGLSFGIWMSLGCTRILTIFDPVLEAPIQVLVGPRAKRVTIGHTYQAGKHLPSPKPVDVRNNESFAHDNDIVNHAEARYIFDSITALLRFIKTIEAEKFGR